MEKVVNTLKLWSCCKKLPIFLWWRCWWVVVLIGGAMVANGISCTVSVKVTQFEPPFKTAAELICRFRAATALGDEPRLRTSNRHFEFCRCRCDFSCFLLWCFSCNLCSFFSANVKSEEGDEMYEWPWLFTRPYRRFIVEAFCSVF